MAAVTRIRAARRELMAARHIPYTAHVAPNVVATTQGDYVQSWRVSGISFESADDEALNGWHERLNALLRNLASSNVALWTHVIRRREWSYPKSQFAPGFAADLNTRYRQRLAGETLMVNELYLSLVYRPQPTAAGAAALKLFGTADPKATRAAQAEAIEACGKLAGQLAAGLAEAETEPLGLYECEGRRNSRLLEFLGLLVNGERSRWALVRSPVNEVLATSRLLFGTEAMEWRTPTATRLAACLGIKEYPTPTAPGANAVISAAASSFRRRGIDVVGFKHGYSALEKYDPKTPLVPDDDYIIFGDRDLQGLRNERGICIGTARANPGRNDCDD